MASSVLQGAVMNVFNGMDAIVIGNVSAPYILTTVLTSE